MSDGFVTVAQCVEGLPRGRFIGELLFCAFLIWFVLGAINESASLSFIYSSGGAPGEAQDASQLCAALAFGNFLAVLLGGWIADKHGRVAVIRTALLLTMGFSVVLQAARTPRQVVVARFLLGLASGAMISVLPALIAELLPAKHRGFYLTAWCCGWPAGALMSLLAGLMSPGLHSRGFYTTLLVPVIVVYICIKADMIPESPRYLYLVGRREEGLLILEDMYAREDSILPWDAESIAVTCSLLPTQEVPGSSSSTVPSKITSSSSTRVAVWLAAAMFLISAANQSLRIWMPAVLHLQPARPDSHGAVDGSFFGKQAGVLWPAHTGSVGTALSLLSAAPAIADSHIPLLSLLGAVPLNADGHFSQPGASIQDHAHVLPFVLSQAYVVQLLAIVLCAYLSMWVRRKHLVQGCLPAAALFTGLTVCVAHRGMLLLCGPLLGLQFAAQACCVNFLQAFAAEHFPTSRRAQVVAGVVFASQLGDFLMPVVGGLVLQNMSNTGAILFFSGLYVIALVVTCRLPLPTFRERSLHDVDEPRCPKEAAARRKRGLTNYQSM